LAMFAGKGVTQEMLEKRLNKPLSDFSGQDMVDLRGMYNAIDAGELSLETAFGAMPAEMNGKQNDAIPGAPQAKDLFKKREKSSKPSLGEDEHAELKAAWKHIKELRKEAQVDDKQWQDLLREQFQAERLEELSDINALTRLQGLLESKLEMMKACE